MSKTALISSASSGIGLELAGVLAENGFDGVLVARSHDKLSELATQLERDHQVKTLVVAKLMAGKSLVIPGFSNKLVPWVVRLSPRRMVPWVVRRMQERVRH